jgi:hypothetical protein
MGFLGSLAAPILSKDIRHADLVTILTTGRRRAAIHSSVEDNPAHREAWTLSVRLDKEALHPRSTFRWMPL